MIKNPFKITESEKNRIQRLHENIKDKPQLDGSLNYSTPTLLEKTGPCKNVAKCRNPFTWDPNVCDCVCKQGQKGCKPGFSWSQDDCKCVRSNSKNKCCCKNRETGKIEEKIMKGDRPCTCKSGWIKVKCDSNTSGRGCCCNCKTNTSTSMPAGGCKELTHIKAWTGPCDGKGCKEACKDFAPNLQSESRLKRIVKRTINESQLLLERPGCKSHGTAGDGWECPSNARICMNYGDGSYGCCAPGDRDCMRGERTTGTGGTVRDGGKTKGDSNKGRGSVMGGTKLNERKLTNIIRKVMSESELLMEKDLVCDAGACGTCGPKGTACKNCCEKSTGCGDCSHWDKVAAGGGKTKTQGVGKPSCGSINQCVDKLMSMGKKPTSKSAMVKMLSESRNRRRFINEEDDETYWEKLWKAWKKAWGAGRVATGGNTGGVDRGKKLNERTLTNIIRKVMFESQLLNEIQNCVGQADGTECDGGCDDTPPSCFQGTCQDGVCKPNSSSTGGGKTKGTTRSRHDRISRREMEEGTHSPYGDKNWGSNKGEYDRFTKGGVKHKAGVVGGKKYGKGGHYKTYENKKGRNDKLKYTKDASKHIKMKEQVYELPVKFGRKRMTESQLVRMIKHIIKNK